MSKSKECPQCDTSYKLGISSGLEQAAKLLLDYAKDSFVDGDDKIAKEYRDLSEILDEKSMQAHPRYAKDKS